ncbi:uncharacterized protein LOC120081684 isoform X2 [Benincasa hispida]|uniref:uncharacterized protein LOC120081684 isoform X2 n=1 Tax=Benincasa hispida TaxID=102211 RepID=UPI0018FFB7E7|nr:uncharacterized protein LOC120081684 isoform X2 [Benincasa hispida]XP_038892691.1 uncharacterized protein LOC120081684 isoform X2 [Benincasa hispida]XP_038892692.1 uncharacterized protein LOC120081684 isoform X2 [Benincasa hispida]XP_038892693.1 uncharacterized protein LOC120081684 isoform X2 [Benincasa hispida]XP_038892694.1 uncharacterized protein LOC120081684 isoform X2 [Benincasa hispida]
MSERSCGGKHYHYNWVLAYTIFKDSNLICGKQQIPASFSLELKRDLTSLVEKQSRKLLDTEKLLFKTEGMNLLGDQVDTHVLVTVKSEGVVAIPSVQERESIIFNIACDELLIGIPHKAWGVGGLVIFCLILAFIIPSLLPSWLLQTNQTQGPGNHHASKSS